MDLENGYYLVRFSEEEDYSRVLTKGPWVIFRQYLTVRHWSFDFLTSKDEVGVQVVWVRLSGLSESLYSSYLLKAIVQTIGTMVRIDENTLSATRGRFTRLAIRVDLRKPLVSKIRINGRL